MDNITKEKRIIELRKNGYGYKVIAKLLGISRENARYFCKKNNLAGNDVVTYQTKLCGTCSISFVQKSTNQLYCSNSCRPSNQIKKKKLCVTCNKEISNRNNKYCNDECRPSIPNKK